MILVACWLESKSSHILNVLSLRNSALKNGRNRMSYVSSCLEGHLTFLLFLPDAATQSSHRANWGSKLSNWGSKTEKCFLTWEDWFLKFKVLLHVYLLVQVGIASTKSSGLLAKLLDWVERTETIGKRLSYKFYSKDAPCKVHCSRLCSSPWNSGDAYSSIF